MNDVIHPSPWEQSSRQRQETQTAHRQLQKVHWNALHHAASAIAAPLEVEA